MVDFVELARRSGGRPRRARREHRRRQCSVVASFLVAGGQRPGNRDNNFLLDGLDDDDVDRLGGRVSRRRGAGRAESADRHLSGRVRPGAWRCRDPASQVRRQRVSRHRLRVPCATAASTPTTGSTTAPGPSQAGPRLSSVRRRAGRSRSCAIARSSSAITGRRIDQDLTLVSGFTTRARGRFCFELGGRSTIRAPAHPLWQRHLVRPHRRRGAGSSRSFIRAPTRRDGAWRAARPSTTTSSTPEQRRKRGCVPRRRPRLQRRQSCVSHYTCRSWRRIPHRLAGERRSPVPGPTPTPRASPSTTRPPRA